MTVPTEEGNALIYASLFLRSLLYKELTPRVPKEIRMKARARLKHFPGEYEIREYMEKKYGKDVSKSLAEKEKTWDLMISHLKEKEQCQTFVKP